MSGADARYLLDAVEQRDQEIARLRAEVEDMRHGVRCLMAEKAAAELPTCVTCRYYYHGLNPQETACMHRQSAANSLDRGNAERWGCTLHEPQPGEEPR